MGVNMVGFCISDDEACKEASKQEVIRRYYRALMDEIADKESHAKEISNIENIMDQLEISPEDRKVVRPAVEKEKEFNVPCAAIELSDGTIIIGKNKEVFGCASAAVLNAIKHLAGIPDDKDLVPNYLMTPVQNLKVTYLGGKNPRLHIDEALIAIAVNAADDENAAKALKQLPLLAGCDMHLTVIPSQTEMSTLRKLKINFTCEPKYSGNKLFRL